MLNIKGQGNVYVFRNVEFLKKKLLSNVSIWKKEHALKVHKDKKTIVGNTHAEKPEDIVELEGGEKFSDINLVQQLPDTPIFTHGKTVYIEGPANLINCKIGKNVVLIGNNFNVCKKDFCRHLHPNFTKINCEEECKHYVGTDKDGTKQYKDITIK